MPAELLLYGNMQSLINVTPYTRVFARTKYLRQISGRGALPSLTPCYIVAVRVVLNEAVRVIILTEEGAMFDSVPPHAICFQSDAPEVPLREVCRWDCLADAGEIIELDFVKRWRIQWAGQIGTYLFTLHFDPRKAWNLLPDQLKLFHFIQGDDGNLYIRVNNEMRWLCEALDQPDKMTVFPESNMKVWSCESGGSNHTE